MVLAIGLDFVAKEQIVSQFVVVKLIHIQITGLGDLGSVVNVGGLLTLKSRCHHRRSGSQVTDGAGGLVHLKRRDSTVGSREQPS